eukprot:jgi/Phyca11/111057/e_gw1.19.475.1
MPKRILWREIASDAEADEGEAILDALKSFDIRKSHTMVCTVCTELGCEPHKIRYRLLVCSSDACGDSSSSSCAWRGKLLTCTVTRCVSIYDVGDHNSDVVSPKKKKLTGAQKEFCRELTELHVRPLRIHHALSRKFSVPQDSLPPLGVVQNYVNHYSRTHLENHDRVDELRAWVHERAYTGAEAMDEPFTFGWQLDGEGKPVVGDGSDQKPFVVGLTTKALVMRLLQSPDHFILHIDATYKMNCRGYPVVVVGVSDRSRQFHLVALYVVSQETQPIFEAALFSLRRLFYWITQRDLRVRYAMADADQAQYNALHAALGHYPGFQFIMCFFHVVKNVMKWTKPFPSGVTASLVRDVYDLHFTKSDFEFQQLREEILMNWMSDSSLVGFAQYMRAQWLHGRFRAWQTFLTPSGFAATNNPSETFNAIRPFSYDISTSKTLRRRVAEMTRERLIGVCVGLMPEYRYAGGSTILKVASQLAKRVSVAPHKRNEEGIAVSAQMGVNYARMEVQNQPWGGWPVDITQRWCPCNYCYAFGVCVHVLFALRITENVDSSGRSVLVNRSKRRRAGDDVGGRPLSVGAALTF